MHDLYAFLHQPRREAGRQPVQGRLRHWHEFLAPMPPAQAETQAARCMDCGTPWCHRYCPVHNLVPQWNERVAEDDWQGAWAALEATNNFPELTGRLCPAPCEDACTLRLSGSPVTIRDLELAIAEHAWQAGWVRPRRARRRHFQRVLVVGSGPAGLACAQQLARVGYRVTVLERDDRIGGLLRYGIPDFRLDKAILDRRLAQLAAEGVRFRTGVDVGRGLGLDRLRREGHAIVLACGSRVPRDLHVPGRGLRGIHFAMDYLAWQNRRVAGDDLPRRRGLSARGLDLVVIGGGDTGADCVSTALRQGARSVTQIQYHERPHPADVSEYWPEPVPAVRRPETEEEGCRHLWGWDTVAFEGHRGRVRAVRLQRLRWYQDDQGRWQRQRLPGRTLRLPAQRVLLAMGYAHPEHHGLVRQAGLALDARGNLAAPEPSFTTNLPGVFACGDMRRGQSLVVWAIREGRRCAHAVDSWLRGHSDLPYD